MLGTVATLHFARSRRPLNIMKIITETKEKLLRVLTSLRYKRACIKHVTDIPIITDNCSPHRPKKSKRSQSKSKFSPKRSGARLLLTLALALSLRVPIVIIKLVARLDGLSGLENCVLVAVLAIPCVRHNIRVA